MIQRRSFFAMGTTVETLLDCEARAGPAALLEVEVEFERLERVLSRFRPDSDLSELNRRGRIDGSPDLARVVELAIAAREQTNGRFDPTIHDALVDAGYDRTFDEVAPMGPADSSARTRVAQVGGAVRTRGDSIALAAGVRIDLGGIGKGYAVDRAVELLGAAGPCLVNAGGDVSVSGLPPEGAWAIAVETPLEPLTLGLTSGALATSGRDRRRWLRGGVEHHHLIDSVTGRPADSPWLRVTVAAPTTVSAEIAAKDIFLGAEPAGRDAVLVARDGSVVRTGTLA